MPCESPIGCLEELIQACLAGGPQKRLVLERDAAEAANNATAMSGLSVGRATCSSQVARLRCSFNIWRAWRAR